MKKVYSKPDIFFESFMMSSSIAYECDGPKGNSGEPDVCEYEENNVSIFSYGVNTDCMLPDPECYHVSANPKGVFGS